MKKIFRYANLGLMLAAVFALGTVASMAQDACSDAAGQTTLGDKFRELYPKKSIEDRRATIDTGKQFLEKYGSCESAQDLADYLKKTLPILEGNLKKMEDAAAQAALYKRFDTSVKSANYAETYASGKEILAKEPDQLDVMIALGSIGYDESYKGNFKFNDETLNFANRALAALDSGKTSKSYGLFQWTYNSRDNAVGWLNYTIGYIDQVAKKDKATALPYLYKATQAKSETATNPIPYELIGGFYFDELNKLTEEIQTMAKGQMDTDTPEVAKQKVDAIKAKVAMANGIAERAIDAFSRAYTLSASTPAAKPYKDKMRANIEGAYKLRFAKTDGVDAYIANTITKPMPNPLTPVTPIFDADPATTPPTGVGSTADVPAAAPTASGAKPAVPAKPTAKPATTGPIKP